MTYGLIYTCNCGWLDLGHLNPNNARNNIGAANLWSQVNNEGPAARRGICNALETTDVLIPELPLPGSQLGREALRRLSGCNNDPYIRFEDGQTGYYVRYRQDHGGHPGRPGAGGTYLVKHELTDSQKRSVALAIFMEVSRRFEDFQSSFVGRQVTDSGYSQEDLVSNLVGFYIAVGLITKSDAISRCHPVSQETSETVWNRSGAVGSNKNRTFEPQLQDTHVVNDAERMCQDDCVGQSRNFPAILNRITPAEQGLYHVKLSNDSLFEL